MEAQRAISIVELDGIKTLFLKGMFDTFLVHTWDFIIHSQRCTGRKYDISCLGASIADNDHLLAVLIG